MKGASRRRSHGMHCSWNMFIRPAADHVRRVRLLKRTKKSSPDVLVLGRMGHNHTISARRMETPAAMVGALLLALIALGRTSTLASREI